MKLAVQKLLVCPKCQAALRLDVLRAARSMLPIEPHYLASCRPPGHGHACLAAVAVRR